MAFDKPSLSPARDPELRKILKAHDPAGIVSPYASAQLAMSISRQALRHTPLIAAAEESDYFTLPPILSGTLSWSVTLIGTMALGLMLGIFISSISAGPAQQYNVATAMADPWHPFAE